jgi:hypothetical protein
VCLVSGRNRVDLAQLAAVTGEAAIRRATAREARDLTGFSIGGIPPFGHGHDVRIVMDPDLCPYPVVWASAGTDAAIFPVPPGTLRILANALVAPIAEEAWIPAAIGIETRMRFETGGSGRSLRHTLALRFRAARVRAGLDWRRATRAGRPRTGQ